MKTYTLLKRYCHRCQYFAGPIDHEFADSLDESSRSITIGVKCRMRGDVEINAVENCPEFSQSQASVDEEAREQRERDERAAKAAADRFEWEHLSDADRAALASRARREHLERAGLIVAALIVLALIGWGASILWRTNLDTSNLGALVLIGLTVYPCALALVLALEWLVSRVTGGDDGPQIVLMLVGFAIGIVQLLTFEKSLWLNRHPEWIRFVVGGIGQVVICGICGVYYLASLHNWRGALTGDAHAKERREIRDQLDHSYAIVRNLARMLPLILLVLIAAPWAAFALGRANLDAEEIRELLILMFTAYPLALAALVILHAVVGWLASRAQEPQIWLMIVGIAIALVELVTFWRSLWLNPHATWVRYTFVAVAMIGTWSIMGIYIVLAARWMKAKSQ